MKPIDELLVAIRQCRVCEPFLEMGVNPVVRASETAELLIVGQAPGRVVHQTSIPWNDKSGDNLRNWLDMDKDVFYDTSKIAIVPMGFCYPGTGKSGDLAPRPECAPLWHSSLLTRMPKLKLILLIGQYAQKYYLKEQAKPTLTETVKNFEAYLPNYFVLPHPSPRNNIWQAKNEWFAEEVVPILRETVQDILNKE
jgi:uracil-DNA glycosylase